MSAISQQFLGQGFDYSSKKYAIRINNKSKYDVRHIPTVAVDIEPNEHYISGHPQSARVTQAYEKMNRPGYIDDSLRTTVDFERLMTYGIYGFRPSSKKNNVTYNRVMFNQAFAKTERQRRLYEWMYEMRNAYAVQEDNNVNVEIVGMLGELVYTLEMNPKADLSEIVGRIRRHVPDFTVPDEFLNAEPTDPDYNTSKCFEYLCDGTSNGTLREQKNVWDITAHFEDEFLRYVMSHVCSPPEYVVSEYSSTNQLMPTQVISLYRTFIIVNDFNRTRTIKSISKNSKFILPTTGLQQLKALYENCSGLNPEWQKVIKREYEKCYNDVNRYEPKFGIKEDKNININNIAQNIALLGGRSKGISRRFMRKYLNGLMTFNLIDEYDEIDELEFFKKKIFFAIDIDDTIVNPYIEQKWNIFVLHIKLEDIDFETMFLIENSLWLPVSWIIHNIVRHGLREYYMAMEKLKVDNPDAVTWKVNLAALRNEVENEINAFKAIFGFYRIPIAEIDRTEIHNKIGRSFGRIYVEGQHIFSPNVDISNRRRLPRIRV